MNQARHTLTATLVAVVLVGAVGLAAPAPAQALPGLSSLGLPSPADLIGGVFESFFKTFFGIQTDVTQRAVRWLLAAPVYTDASAYGDLNRLRASIEVAAWALLTLVFTIAAVRYYASGFTSAGSYEAVEALTRGALAAGALVAYAQAIGSLAIAANSLTYGITHTPAVQSGLTTLLAAATASSFTPLGLGTIAAVVAVVLFVLLVVCKIVLATLLGLLFVAAPLAIALWPLPETSWLARTVLQGLVGVLLWPVVWALCFALFAVIGASALTPEGSFGSQLVKPWVSVAALYVAFKAPQLLARQAMLAGLMPSPGAVAARGLFYGRAAIRAGAGTAARGSDGASGRVGAGAATRAAG